jgi:hypothetical protein
LVTDRIAIAYETTAFGCYPTVTLAQAREKRDAASPCVHARCGAATGAAFDTAVAGEVELAVAGSLHVGVGRGGENLLNPPSRRGSGHDETLIRGCTTHALVVPSQPWVECESEILAPVGLIVLKKWRGRLEPKGWGTIQSAGSWRPLCTLIIGCGTSVVTLLMKTVRSTFSLGFNWFRTIGPWGLRGLGPLVLGSGCLKGHWPLTPSAVFPAGDAPAVPWRSRKMRVRGSYPENRHGGQHK